jgi:hypothetical protein
MYIYVFLGHGPRIDNAYDKITEYIHHRQLREKQIIEYLSNNQSKTTSDDGWYTSWEIMNAIYPPLFLFVKFSAQWNVLHHLEKLLEDKIIEKYDNDSDYWRIVMNDKKGKFGRHGDSTTTNTTNTHENMHKGNNNSMKYD